MTKTQNGNNENQNGTFSYTLTVLGYTLILLFLLITAPVVCPPLIGSHTYTVKNDSTGLISQGGTVVYAQEVEETTLAEGNIVAVDNQDGDRDVDCYYVDANDLEGQTLALRGGATVSYDLVKGIVKKKTPFIGYLCGMLFHVWGIVLDLIILAAGIAITVCANKICTKQKEEQMQS